MKESLKYDGTPVYGLQTKRDNKKHKRNTTLSSVACCCFAVAPESLKLWVQLSIIHHQTCGLYISCSYLVGICGKYRYHTTNYFISLYSFVRNTTQIAPHNRTDIVNKNNGLFKIQHSNKFYT